MHITYSIVSVCIDVWCRGLWKNAGMFSAMCTYVPGIVTTAFNESDSVGNFFLKHPATYFRTSADTFQETREGGKKEKKARISANNDKEQH